MTLPASGAISIYQVAVELGIGAAGLNLNDSRVRDLARVYSGAISMSSLHGKTRFTYSISEAFTYTPGYRNYPNAVIWDVSTSDGSVPTGVASFVTNPPAMAQHFWLKMRTDGRPEARVNRVAVGITCSYTVVLNMSNGRQVSFNGPSRMYIDYDTSQGG